MRRFLEDEVDYDASSDDSIDFMETLIPKIANDDEDECLNKFLDIQKREYYKEYFDYCNYKDDPASFPSYVDMFDDYISAIKLTNEKLFEAILESDPELALIVDYAKNRKPKSKNVSLAFHKKKEYTMEELLDICFVQVLRYAFAYHKMLNINLADAIQSGFVGAMDAIQHGYFNDWYYDSSQIMYTLKSYIEKAIVSQNRFSDRGVPLDYADHYVKLIKYASAHPDFHYEINDDGYFDYLSLRLNIPIQRLFEICRNEPWIIKNIDSLDDEEEMVLELNNSLDNEVLKERIKTALHTLTPREEQVLDMRCGLTDGKPCTLFEVAKRFRITRERIRQIEDKALRKLKHPSRLSFLIKGR